jgi:F0F1-type ATP synthase membrane subunit a
VEKVGNIPVRSLQRFLSSFSRIWYWKFWTEIESLSLSLSLCVCVCVCVYSLYRKGVKRCSVVCTYTFSLFISFTSLFFFVGISSFFSQLNVCSIDRWIVCNVLDFDWMFEANGSSGTCWISSKRR